jgi:uncharacterized protein (DUF362 family)
MIFTDWGVWTPEERVSVGVVAALVAVAVGTGEISGGPGVGGIMAAVTETGAVGCRVGALLTTDIFSVPHERISRAERTITTRRNHFLDIE